MLRTKEDKVNEILTKLLGNVTINSRKEEDGDMYATDFAQVGANIQRQLDIKGMTQQSLADALQISKQVMNKIIKGSKAINVNELARIAEVLSTSADALLTASNVPVVAESLSFMGAVHDDVTLERVNIIRSAIDEINMLEELLHA